MDVRSDILPDRYADVVKIAAGGMGEIFSARDEELGRRVAVKVLAQRYASDDALRRRFKREALAAARLSGDPNIVTIFDVGEHRRRPFIVMEYMGGGSLQDQAEREASFHPGQVLDWLEDAASALDTAHAAGVIHRDVKPGNLLLDDRGHVHVADFGIASAAGLDSFTKTGTILGTAGYLAPEQARGERATAATDLYALAVVAFELLAGTRPFAADTPTAEAAAHIHAPVPSIHEANPSLPRELDRVFTRALAKEPSARYGTGGEFVADLRAALDEAAGATALFEQGWPSTTRSTPGATAPTRRLDRRRRGGWWIPLLVAALVVGGVALAYLATRDEGGGTATPTTAPAPPPRTFVKTVTQEAQTVERTVTEAAPPPPTTQAAATTTPATGGSQSGASLNDAGFAKMRAGDYAGALPLLEAAVQKLQGTGSLPEAYADYNLAYTRFALGRCDGVTDLLESSKRIQGERSEIRDLKHRAQKACK
jgi:eukaryotic-like serine/threonine-protein kinase